MVELLRGATQDAFQCSLDDGARSQDPLSQLHQPISDLKGPQETHLAMHKDAQCQLSLLLLIPFLEVLKLEVEFLHRSRYIKAKLRRELAIFIQQVSRHCELQREKEREEKFLLLHHCANICSKLHTLFYHIILTSLPKMSLRSWMRIQPSLQPGTSQRLASPPQDRMGTSVLSVARGLYLQSENTCREEVLHTFL